MFDHLGHERQTSETAEPCPLKGFGGVSVMEIVAPFDGKTMAHGVYRPL